MRLIIPALCASLALAGCQTTIDDVDSAIRANLPKACAGFDAAHTSFAALNALHPLKASIVAAELKAYDAAAGFCAHPETATTMMALVTVGSSALAIWKLFSEAQKVE